MPGTTSTTPVNIRFPADIHEGATDCAKRQNTSLTRFVLSAVADAIARCKPEEVPDADAARYSVTVEFTLNSGNDQAAYRLADELANLAELTGAQAPETRITKTAPMDERSTTWRR